MTDEEKFQKTFDKLHASPDVFAYSAKTEHSLRMSGALFR